MTAGRPHVWKCLHSGRKEDVGSQRDMAYLLADYLDALERGESGEDILQAAGHRRRELQSLAGVAEAVRHVWSRVEPPSRLGAVRARRWCGV